MKEIVVTHGGQNPRFKFPIGMARKTNANPSNAASVRNSLCLTKVSLPTGCLRPKATVEHRLENHRSSGKWNSRGFQASDIRPAISERRSLAQAGTVARQVSLFGTNNSYKPGSVFSISSKIDSTPPSRISSYSHLPRCQLPL